VTERLLRTREVAELVGLSPETILRRHRAGELPGVRLASNVLRFRESAVEAWLNGEPPVHAGASGESLAHARNSAPSNPPGGVVR
jgi:excisionase family DNA binding protein